MSRLSEAQLIARPVLEAIAYGNAVWPTSKSGAALVRANDDILYVLKGTRINPITDHGREAANDQIVGRLANAAAIEAVPRVALIDLPANIIAANSSLQHLVPGVWHGIQYVTGSASNGLAHIKQNRGRFAQLALLNAWCGIGDYMQFIYDRHDLVHAYDHGNAFTCGSAWTPEILQQSASAITIK